MVQTTLYRELAQGVEGDLADNTPTRVDGFNLFGKEATKSTGQIVIGSTNPSANNTITIQGQVYKFVSTLSSANDVLIGNDASESALNLVNAINGGDGAGTTYHANTPINTNVIAEINSNTNTTIDLTAIESGIAGNGIILSTTIATGSVVAMTGGENATYPTIARAFTFIKEKEAMQGGNGVFCGILINSKEFVNKNGIGKGSLQLYNGVQGGLCTMGRVFVKSETEVKVGYVAGFNKNNGKINAYADENAIPSDYTLIPNAKFVLQDVSAGANLLAILELN